MSDDYLIDDWDEADFEIFKQWDEEAKNKRLEELNQRIDKAIEYIKTLEFESEETYDISELARNELLEILQGSDKG